MKRLIINADDFGLAPGVNRAVVELQQAGVLTSATLMATGAYFSPAVYLAFAQPGLAQGNPSFGVVSSQSNNPRLIQFALRLTY